MRNLLKALLTTGGATIVAQILGLIVNKILAQTIGATGVGFYSITRQVHDTAAGLGAMGGGGLVQGLAARDGAARGRLLRAAIVLTLAGAAIAATVLLIAPASIAMALFDRADPPAIGIVRLCALTSAIGIAYAVLGAAVNSMRAIVVLAMLSVGGAAATALLAWPTASLAREEPLALALLIGVPLALQTIVAVLALHRMGWWKTLAGGSGGNRPGMAEYRYFARFLGFNAVMTAASAATMLSVRAAIVHDGGLAQAGLFAAAWGIGMQSMSLLLTSFGTYVLPTLAGATADERRRHLQDAATLVLCASIPLLTALIALKPLAVRLLFSAEFLDAVPLLQWLLLGNYLKAISWVMAIPLLASADLRRYFVLEGGWFAVFAAIALVGIDAGYGMISVGAGYLVAYVLYFALGVVFARARFGFALDRRSTAVLAAGLCLIALVAAITWNDATVDWPLAVGASAVAGLVSLLGLTPNQRGKLLRLARTGRLA